LASQIYKRRKVAWIRQFGAVAIWYGEKVTAKIPQATYLHVAAACKAEDAVGIIITAKGTSLAALLVVLWGRISSRGQAACGAEAAQTSYLEAPQQRHPSWRLPSDPWL